MQRNKRNKSIVAVNFSLSTLALLALFSHLINPVKSKAQSPPPPDCVVFVQFTTTSGSAATLDVPASTNGFDNRTLGCQTWTFTYQATAASGALTSIGLQSSTGATAATSFGAWPGTVNTGIDPNTSSTKGTTTYSTGCSNGSTCNVNISWVRIHLIRNTFVGTINGVLYGYRSGYGAGGSGGGGVTSDVNVKQVGGTNTVSGGVAGTLGVGGPTASGAALAARPVLVGGSDGTNVVNVSVDAGGRPIPSSASSANGDGVSNTNTSPTGLSAGILYQRNLNYLFNGTTWDRAVGNTSGAPTANASLAAADGTSNTELVPTSAGGTILFYRTMGSYYNGTTWDRVVGNTAGAAPSNASSAGADAISNTNLGITSVGGTQIYNRGLQYVYNGTTWDRMPGTTAGVKVIGNLTNNNAVPAATNIGVLPALANAAAPTYTETDQVLASVDLGGNLRIIPGASAAADRAAVGCYVNGGVGSAASTNSTNCKASAGNVYGYRLINTTATLAYLRMYNASSAPTCSSATGFIESIPVPASATGAGVVALSDIAINYTTGIGFCLTANAANNDNNAAGAGIFVTIYYK